jgi:hypothetical protein
MLCPKIISILTIVCIWTLAIPAATAKANQFQSRDKTNDSSSASDPEGAIPRVAGFPESINYWNVSTKPEEFFEKVRRGDQYYKDSSLVLAIGDSWFAYPKNWGPPDPVDPPSNILTSLGKVSRDYWTQKDCAVSILSLSNSGEIVSNMAGLASADLVDTVESVQRDVNVLQVAGHSIRRASSLNRSFDYILLSGGGNDLLSNARLNNLFKHSFESTSSDPIARIDEPLAKHYILHVKDSYRVLMSYLLKVSPNSKIFAHTYDYFYPSPNGAEFATLPAVGPLVTKGKGGWYYPVAMTYGLTDPKQQRIVSNYLLDKFAVALTELSQEPAFKDRFYVIDTRTEMNQFAVTKNIDEPSLWLNEIHLDSRGYDVVGRAFLNKILKIKGSPCIPRYSN